MFYGPPNKLPTRFIVIHCLDLKLGLGLEIYIEEVGAFISEINKNITLRFFFYICLVIIYFRLP